MTCFFTSVQGSGLEASSIQVENIDRDQMEKQRERERAFLAHIAHMMLTEIVASGSRLVRTLISLYLPASTPSPFPFLDWKRKGGIKARNCEGEYPARRLESVKNRDHHIVKQGGEHLAASGVLGPGLSYNKM